MEELKPIKRCEYHNCIKVIEGKSNKKFCCDNCRKMYHTYERRSIKRLRNEKQAIRDMINTIQIAQDTQVDPKVLELFNLINRN